MLSEGREPPSVTVDAPATGVWRVRIGNERHRGALSTGVLDGLERAFSEVPADARCILIIGTGRTFSAGYDLSALTVPLDPVQTELTVAPNRVRALEMLDEQPLPVVGALNGPALGGGLELALACDIRLATPGASLSAPAGRLGLVYSPTGLERIMAELPFALGSELLLAGAAISAQRAYQLGLVSRIVEPEQLEEVAVQTAAQVAELAPLAARGNREGLHALRRSAARLLPEDRERTARARERALTSLDFTEGLTAFRERRPPRFSGS